MDTMPEEKPMDDNSHAPLGGLDPAGLLRQGAAEDTLVDDVQPSFAPPSIEELAPLFPQFEILDLIGKGGMGAVYKARQKDLDRIVALKILPPAIGGSPAFSSRFTREAKALAKLNHPGIVTIHEFGQRDGLYFIVMEFVDGVNLAQLLKTGRVSPREALAIVPQICDALQYAHDQGIVHRDIKPENILLDRLGRVKVADFGIAKIVSAVCDDPMRRGDNPVPADATIAGNIMGTPQYMAPEQVEHPADVDHRADIYALGVVFYQMLTGELPGKDLQAPSRKVHIDVRLDEIVLQAMEKNPELRFQQASVMKTRVETVASTSEPSTAESASDTSTARFSHQIWLVVALVAVVLAFFNPWGGIAWQYFAAACAILGVLAAFDGVWKSRFRGKRLWRSENRPQEGASETANEPPITHWLQSLIGLLLVLCLPGSLVFPRFQDASYPSWDEEEYVFSVPGHENQTRVLDTLVEVLSPYPGIVLKADFSSKKWKISATDAACTAADYKLKQASAAIQREYDKGTNRKLAVPIVWESRSSMSSNAMSIENRPGFIANLKRSLWVGLLMSAVGMLCLLVRRERKRFHLGDPGKLILVLVMLGCFSCLFVPGPHQSIWSFLLFGGVLMGGSIIAVALGGRFMRFEFWMVVGTWVSTAAFLVAGQPHWGARLDPGWKTVPLSVVQNAPLPAPPDLNAASDKEPIQGRYQEAVLEWLGEIDAGRHEKAWSEAAAFARSLESPSQWATKMRATRTPLGKVLSRQVRQTRWTSKLSGAPEGEYLIYVFQTEFEPGPRMLETVTLMFEQDGNWRVIAYSIEPDGEQDESVRPQDSVSAGGSMGKVIAEIQPEETASTQESAAVDSAQAWLAGIDAGNFPQSWKDAAAYFRGAMTEATWSATLTQNRKPLGTVVLRKLKSSQSVESLPGAPDGKYVVMQFDTSFTGKKAAVETVTFMQEEDGKWRAVGYFIH